MSWLPGKSHHFNRSMIFPARNSKPHFTDFGGDPLPCLPDGTLVGSRMSLNCTGWWLTYLKNMSSSVGIIIPNIWKNKNVPNHQPV
jgi:hypothetical protein